MEFIKENLVLVLTLVSFVVFAIIGYIVDHSKNKDNKEKDILKEDITEEGLIVKRGKKKFMKICL